MTLAFFVRGTPRPGGSKTAMPVYGAGGHPVTRPTATGKNRPVLRYVDDAKGNEQWKASVALQAKAAGWRAGVLDEPLDVEFHFFMARPKGHFRTNGGLHEWAPPYPASKPDVLKLARSTEDALTGIVWRDDAANVRMTLRKDYASSHCPEGVAIRITTMTNTLL